MRHRRRTFFSALTIASGMLLFITMDSMLAGMDRGAIDNMIALTSAALRIRTPEYAAEQDALPLDYGHKNVAEITSFLKNRPQVKGVAPRTRFIGQLSVEGDLKPVVGTVIDPAADSTVFSLVESIEGTYFTADNGHEIILGKKLADNIGVAVGGWITLYAQTRYEAHNADDFRVVGLLNTSDPVLNSSGVFMSYAAADTFLDLGGIVTDIMVGLHPRVNLHDFLRDAKTVKAEVKRQWPSLMVETCHEQEAGFFEISKTKRSFGMVYLVVLLLIAAVGIFNTVLMSVYERIRECGVLRSFGLRRGELTRLFLYEGFLTGIIGTTFGIIASLCSNLLLVTRGFPLDKMAGEAMGDFPVWGVVYGQWNLGMWVTISLFSIGIATLAGLIPARKAGAMEITATLRFV